MNDLPKIEKEEDFIEVFSHFFHVPKEDIIKHSRKKELVEMRDLVVFFLREYAGMSFPVIGRLLDRDHTTIIHSYRKTKENLQTKKSIIQSEFDPLIKSALTIKERRELILEQIRKEILSADILPELSSRPVFREIPERNLKILEMYREGLTLTSIGSAMGITRERVRQVVLGTLKQTAINDSVTRGIIINSDILIEEEKKKRIEKIPKAIKPIKPPKENRWSKYYLCCRKCNTTSAPHRRGGFCERCLGDYRGKSRDNIISQHFDKCDLCKKTRIINQIETGRDLYITKDLQVMCRNCFLRETGKMLGNITKARWKDK